MSRCHCRLGEGDVHQCCLLTLLYLSVLQLLAHLFKQVAPFQYSCDAMARVGAALCPVPWLQLEVTASTQLFSSLYKKLAL